MNIIMTNKQRLTRQQLKKIKSLSLNELDEFLQNLYIEGYEAGLREGEMDFNDPDSFVIMDADDVRDKLGEEAFNKLGL